VEVAGQVVQVVMRQGRPIAACTSRGVPTPMVSATPQCCTPISFSRRATIPTSLAGTLPW
jgi:hypothetical protein